MHAQCRGARDHGLDDRFDLNKISLTGEHEVQEGNTYRTWKGVEYQKNTGYGDPSFVPINLKPREHKPMLNQNDQFRRMMRGDDEYDKVPR